MMTPLLAADSNAALVTFMIYTLAVFGIAALSNQLMKSKSFMSEYFLGSRGLGVWAFALTFAATSSSGGSFTGFPAKIYTHGWVLALWIGSYMVVPICTMGFIGKRLNQVARISGAITIPDVLRDRFNSKRFGLLAVILIVFFMSFNLVAQFKAGATILKVLLSDVKIFTDFSASVSTWLEGSTFFGTDGQYLVCLLFFGVAVIAYTTYGGFHAVVWTDVMQGIVMILGVLILLPLAISAVGGLSFATQEMSTMTPPMRGYAEVASTKPLTEAVVLDNDDWLMSSTRNPTRVFRVARPATIQPGDEINFVEVLEITSPSEVKRILAGEDDSVTMKGEIDLNFREDLVAVTFSNPGDSRGSITVHPGPMTGDYEFKSGEYVVAKDSKGTLRNFRVVEAAGPFQVPLNVDLRVAEGNDFDSAVMTWNKDNPLTLVSASMSPVSYQYGHGEQGHYVTGPGPSPRDSLGFLPLSVAISFFFMWAISGAGQPSNMVRLMAFNNSRTLQRAIFTVAIYYTCIYLPLVVIFCCARVLVPGMEAEPDRIMPEMAVYLTDSIGAGWLGGLLIAAPFAAVMSTVDSFLLMISSAVVRDIYQRNIKPDASEGSIKKMSYLCTLIVGTAAMVVAINPPNFLQDIIVYVGSGLAACFLAPVVFLLYWPRATESGCIIGMLSGFAAHFAMYTAGIFTNGSFFRPYRLFDFDPIIVGLGVSFLITFLATRATTPPSEEIVRKYFYRKVQG